MTKDDLLLKIRDGASMSAREKLMLTLFLSYPAILAQLASILMQYIDASMVGSIGAVASASIGLVSTTIWLFGGLCSVFSQGFSVMVAHRIGAGDEKGARDVVREGLCSVLFFCIILGLVGAAISPSLPLWLGGGEDICQFSSRYFLVVALTLPVMGLERFAGGCLRASGNMKFPSSMNVLMCVLDVIFNVLFIFPSRTLAIGHFHFFLPGLGLGVFGAALATSMSLCVVCALLWGYICISRTPVNITREPGRMLPSWKLLRSALSISVPMGIERCVTCGAQIASTVIVAPLGTVAIAANTLGITIESLCYMPGYGVAEASTTLVGQSVGARRWDLCRQFAYITVSTGVLIMTVMGIIMYISAPVLMQMMTPDAQVVSLGVQVLRIEAFAEPLFAASIVAYSCFVGVGKTMSSSFINVASMWGIRLTMAYTLAPVMGLAGVWLAMCVELCARGAMFLARLFWYFGYRLRQKEKNVISTEINQ